MAAGVAVRIFVWIRRLAYRIDGARLGIVRCWGLAAVGGLGLICWLACCFFFVGRGCRVFSGSTLSIVFWFSPVSSLSHHQDICYTEYVHIKIMKEETIDFLPVLKGGDSYTVRLNEGLRFGGFPFHRRPRCGRLAPTPVLRRLHGRLTTRRVPPRRECSRPRSSHGRAGHRT